MYIVAIWQKGKAAAAYSYIGNNKETMIASAMTYKRTQGYNDAKVLIAEVTGEAKQPDITYDVVPFDETTLK